MGNIEMQNDKTYKSTDFYHSVLDAVGSWQKILPMPNLERAY